MRTVGTAIQISDIDYTTVMIISLFNIKFIIRMISFKCVAERNVSFSRCIITKITVQTHIAF